MDKKSSTSKLNTTNKTTAKPKTTQNDSKMGDISITKNICFSNLRDVSENDEIGRSLYFENNGRKIFAKGRLPITGTAWLQKNLYIMSLQILFGLVV